MELLIFVAFGFLIAPLLVSIAAFVRSRQARDRADQLVARIGSLETEVTRLVAHVRTSSSSEGRAMAPEPPRATPAPESIPRPIQSPPPLPVVAVQTISAQPKPMPSPVTTMSAARADLPIQPRPASPPARVGPVINWEQFMGAKLFAWIGGLALFLGIAFFVKYSFEHNLIPPAVRVAIGFLAGIGLLVGGVLMKRKALAVTAQTLCATGILILYATTFACRSFYHFPFFGLLPTLLLMSLITAVAFTLAVRLEAHVVAVLGMLGGFLTPLLLSTGEDNPFGLFGYIALLDAGLIAVALHRRWHYLVPLGAAATILMQIAWTGKFFRAERYFEGNKVLIAMAVLIGLQALFLAGAAWAKRRAALSRAITGSALSMAFVALLFAAYFLSFGSLGQRPILLFSYVFVADLGLLALVLLDSRRSLAQPIAGLFVFALLGAWTGNYLSDALLSSALGLYLVFTVFHALVPLALQRLGKVAPPPWWSQTFPVLALLLVVGPLLQSHELSFLIWPFILLVDLLAVLLAGAFATLLPILFVLVLTLGVTAVAIERIPVTLTGLPTSLAMLGIFAVFFLGASVWLTRQLARRVGREAGGFPGTTGLPDRFAVPADLTSLLPGCSVVLPFLLLIMVTARLPISDPTPVFGLALLLVILLFGVTRFLAVQLLPLIGLLSTLALENAWHFRHFDPASAELPLAWYLGFYAIFTVYPFVFRREFAGKTLPWAAAALAGPLHFPLIHRLVQEAYPNGLMGLLPAAFSIPSLLALASLIKTTRVDNPARNSQLALFGGAALFFITLIFPVQFERQWVTIGWALEGVALCWLFRRIPHPGLRLLGVALLVVAFIRLALNPAVLSYHPRSETAIFNWFLYAYGVVTASLFAGARLLAPPRHLVLGHNTPPLLYALGAALAFLLVNIEIADYFTSPGAPVVTLQFSGNLARDMTYSIAWALFALLLVIVGIRQKLAPVRYAGIGLLSITILKLFLRDLSQLGQLYRIGALVVVAVVAIFASFLYQRFLAAGEKIDEKPIPPRPV